jgi:fumarate hydratase class II
VQCHGGLKTIANTLFNVANNIRWLGSGPRCGFGEIQLPTRQPGSSIMPGKVNPVMCESMMQVAARVIGNDQTVTLSGLAGGNFQLNIMMPVMGHATLESIALLTSVVNAFVDLCAVDIEANEDACAAAVEQSLSMVTSLNPYVGYEKACQLAKEALASGATIRELCEQEQILSEEELNHALDAMRMTEPQE